MSPLPLPDQSWKLSFIARKNLDRSTSPNSNPCGSISSINFAHAISLPCPRSAFFLVMLCMSPRGQSHGLSKCNSCEFEGGEEIARKTLARVSGLRDSTGDSGQGPGLWRQYSGITGGLQSGLLLVKTVSIPSPSVLSNQLSGLAWLLFHESRRAVFEPAAFPPHPQLFLNFPFAAFPGRWLSPASLSPAKERPCALWTTRDPHSARHNLCTHCVCSQGAEGQKAAQLLALHFFKKYI